MALNPLSLSRITRFHQSRLASKEFFILHAISVRDTKLGLGVIQCKAGLTALFQRCPDSSHSEVGQGSVWISTPIQWWLWNSWASPSPVNGLVIENLFSGCTKPLLEPVPSSLVQRRIFIIDLFIINIKWVPMMKSYREGEVMRVKICGLFFLSFFLKKASFLFLSPFFLAFSLFCLKFNEQNVISCS